MIIFILTDSDQNSHIPSKMDESFFKFGQILKPLKGLPVELTQK